MRLATVVLALAGLSALLAAPAAAYDPWAWLLWGREIAHGTLSTAEGPAFKPLPVGVATGLSLLGSAAPVAWVLLARAGAIAALVLAFRLGRERAGGAAAGAAAVAGTGGFLALAANGHAEGLLLASALGSAEAWRRGRPRLAFALAVACGLIRVEAWPFLLAAAVAAWRHGARPGPLLAAAALVPAAWFVPELLGSGDLLRSGDRARVPNPGQPALAGFPFGASLRDAAGLVPWAAWPGLLAAATLGRRGLLLPAIAGAAWAVLVALMAQAGFSGEARYALPGAALVALSGGLGLALAAHRATKTTPRVAVIAHGAVVAVLVAPILGDVREIRGGQAHAWRLQRDLPGAIAAAGGRDAVLACGTAYVGPLRGPLLAYHLAVSKHTIEPDRAPRAPGTAFRSRRLPSLSLEPAADAPLRPVAASGAWIVERGC